MHERVCPVQRCRFRSQRADLVWAKLAWLGSAQRRREPARRKLFESRPVHLLPGIPVTNDNVRARALRGRPLYPFQGGGPIRPNIGICRCVSFLGRLWWRRMTHRVASPSNNRVWTGGRRTLVVAFMDVYEALAA